MRICVKRRVSGRLGDCSKIQSQSNPVWVVDCIFTYLYTILYFRSKHDLLQGSLWVLTGLHPATWTLFPPTCTCMNPDCPKQCADLILCRKDGPHQVTLFTLSKGVCPTYSIHLYCYGAYHASTSFHSSCWPCNCLRMQHQPPTWPLHLRQ